MRARVSAEWDGVFSAYKGSAARSFPHARIIEILAPGRVLSNPKSVAWLDGFRAGATRNICPAWGAVRNAEDRGFYWWMAKPR